MNDAERDALALIGARLRDDDEGAAAVLDHADLRALASKLAEYLAVTARMVGGSQATGEELAEKFALRLRDMRPG